MNSSSNSAVLDRAFEPLAECFTTEVAGRIAALRATPEVQNRIDELADKSSAGTLSIEERAEYEAWVRNINVIEVLQAKARKIVAAQKSS